VYVPAGCFLMGSPESDQDAKENEKPQHNVCLTHAYWIGKYEVTNEEYQQFVDAGGYSNRDYWSEAGWAWKAGRMAPIIYPEQASDPMQPRVGITWYEAEAFAKWAGGRLPTEAEWEYAARGPQARLYPWGSQYRIGVANINESSVGGAYLDRSTTVGSYPGGVSWVGAHDMAGNVWEWCADSYDEHYYSQQIRDDPVGAESGDEHSLRGGSWISSPAGVRAAVRSRGLPDYQFRYNGMRIVVPVE
ncbi:MAG: SUMF1/EgtB/PvdO family nonheme iron enzyme, partial [Anaerolineae bacterium]|nr:SUMF1/EgtB/PvdO family nonheme iron enzyme [Anaerolineae bacterium]